MRAFSLLILLLVSTPAFSGNSFPVSPDLQLTPGSLCDRPDSKRYPEGVPYCSRHVRSELKVKIIKTYDSKLGYYITSMNRDHFKIDHFIPLCMGGSNNPDNLWPQHYSVFTITDPMEPLLCNKMAEGKLRQADAVELIRRGKLNLNEVPAILDYVQKL